MPTSRDLADADPSPAVAEIARDLLRGKQLMDELVMDLAVETLLLLVVIAAVAFRAVA
jgi:hypothetical protein